MDNLKLNRNEILEYLESFDLQIGEITYGSNNYPSNLGDFAVTGFNTYEQAKDLAQELEVDICLFKKKDGWHFWEKMGDRHKPLTYQDYLYDLGDDYQIISDMNQENDYYEQTIKDFASKWEFNKIQNVLNERKNVIDKLEELPETHVLIKYCYGFFETFPKECMFYHEDVTTWEVGLFVPRD